MQWNKFAAGLVALSALTGVGMAQTSKAILVGNVRDSSGAVIPHAKITVTSQLTGETRTTSANGEGAYRIEALNPSIYKLHFEAPGFKAIDVKDLQLSASIVTSYEAKLPAGDVSTSVDVEAESNGVNLDNGHLASTVNAMELAKVPIFTLNPVELTATVPGAQFINDNSQNLGGVGGQYYHVEFNGARPRANNFMLDGQDINDIALGGQAFQPQIPDMFQSVVIYTNNAPAEFGRAAGGVVNLITKAGSNQYHGSAFELYSGSGLNSVDGITRKNSTSRSNKARFDQHQFGFTGGGPIWKNKLFAFGGTMFTRYYGKQSSNQVELPDAAGYAVLTSIGGPQVALLQSLLANGSYLTSYQLTSAPGQPVESLNVGAMGGCTSNCIVTTGNFQRPPIALQAPDTQWFYRIDFTPHEKDTFGFRYFHDRNNFNPDLALNPSNLPGFDAQVGGPTELATGTWTHLFTPTLLNELRGSETRIHFYFTALPSALANPVANVENINLLSSPGIPTLGLSQNIPQGTKEDTYQFQDTVSWTKGKHSVRAGVDIGRSLQTFLVPQTPNGILNFAKDSNGSSLVNFLNNKLGVSGTAVKSFGPTRLDPHVWRSAYFIQDDIKLLPSLTVNLGFRYDYLPNPGNAVAFPGVNLANPYESITAVHKIATDDNDFGPRIGFAYSPSGGWFGQGKTVIHGGFSIAYDPSFGNLVTNTAASAPNSVSGTLTSTTAVPLSNATGLIATIPATLSNFSTLSPGVDMNLKNQRTYQMNLGFERALPDEIKLVVNYVGSRGRKLYANQQLNYLNNSTPAAIAAGQRLNTTRGIINVRANSAASEYDGLQAEVSRQFKHGLFFRAAYTFSKNMDDGSEVFTTFASPTSYSANLAPGGRRQDWSASAFDFPQYFSLTYVWSPAGFHASNHVANVLLGAATRNFTVSGITQLQAGPPSTINFLGLDSNNDGSTANDRPIVGNIHAPITTVGIDGIYLGATQGQYYDLVANNQTNAVNPVTVGQVHWLIPYGGASITPLEVGRNTYRNAGTTNWNLALQKDIPTPWMHLPSAAFVLRAEAQNLFNHNDVGIVDTNLLDDGNGNNFLNAQNARVNTNRNVRFWAKFTF